MMQMHTPELVQNTIVLSVSRKDEMAAAMNDARERMEKTLRQSWEPYVETPAQKLANARAARIASLIESLQS